MGCGDLIKVEIVRLPCCCSVDRTTGSERLSGRNNKALRGKSLREDMKIRV